MPEQYYAEYTDDAVNGPDGMVEFAEALRRLERGSDWQLDRSGSGKQEVFDALLDGVVTEPAETDEVVTLLDTADRPVELGVPDERSAAGLYRWIRRHDDDLSVTICTNGTVEELPETDVVVVPGGADRVGAPTGETRRRRSEKRRAAAVERARSALWDAVSVARSTSDSEAIARSRVAAGLDRVGIGAVGISVSPTRGRRETVRHASLWLSFGGAIGLLLAMGVVLGIDRPGASLDVLRRTVRIGVPFGPSIGSVTAWTLLGLAAGTTASATAACLYAGHRSVESPSDRLVEHAETVLTALETIREVERTTTPNRNDAGANRADGRITGAVRSLVDRWLPGAERSGEGDRFERLVSNRVFADEPFEVERPGFGGVSERSAVAPFFVGVVVAVGLILLPAAAGVAAGRYASVLSLLAVVTAATVAAYAGRRWLGRGR